MDFSMPRRGFLPETDPLSHFDPASDLSALDELGRDLPSLLQDQGFRTRARALKVPPLPPDESRLPVLRLYYVRLGFLASAYVNQVGEEPARLLPANIAEPLCDVCARLNRPPILSYDGYALFNWKRFDPDGPIALGNIDTIQNFVHLYDEHWFILVHVEIEALAARQLEAVLKIEQALAGPGSDTIDQELATIVETLWRQVAVLRRIPEKMDPALYYRTFRPYIRFFEGVVYEGINTAPLDFRGETGAQSSVVPALVSLLKVPHRPTQLTDHLADMRRFMPAEHRAILDHIEAMPPIKPRADRVLFNEALEALATFRETHLGFAQRYIAQWVDDPRGTGGTPYMRWLAQLIEETRAHKVA
jgi:indoleamine 2,3-dioxygenase